MFLHPRLRIDHRNGACWSNGGSASDDSSFWCGGHTNTSCSRQSHGGFWGGAWGSEEVGTRTNQKKVFSRSKRIDSNAPPADSYPSADRQSHEDPILTLGNLFPLLPLRQRLQKHRIVSIFKMITGLFYLPTWVCATFLSPPETNRTRSSFTRGFISSYVRRSPSPLIPWSS